MKYLLLNLFVTLCVIVYIKQFYSTHVSRVRLLYVLVIMLTLTAIFDSLIVYSGIVAYNLESILGIYIGKAPIEDFFYAIVAAILGPVLWDYYEKK